MATNAGGPHCLAYGVTSGHVLALELALPGGEVVLLGAEGPEAAGYDLRGLVVGSEGTLGVITAVCVRLTPVAPAVRTMLLEFASVADATATVAGVVAAGVVPAAMELLDRRILEVIEPYVHAGYPTDADAVLLVEVEAGGVLSGEHGIGLEKRDLMPLLFSADDLAVQDCARAAFDPGRRLNPGKVLPSGARCGDFAMARGQDLAATLERLPEGSWI